MFLTKILQNVMLKIQHKEITDIFGCNIFSIKGKFNGLRVQYGREMAKVNKMKSGQSRDDLYVSNWAHY